MPGTIALGVHVGASPAEYLEIAKNLTRTCYEMYNQMETKLSPEVVYFNTKETAMGRDIYTQVCTTAKS